ncbi:hypothetical protein OD91_1003 [Lutibacter sp. Hel_I_33_5]|uniref:DUF6428 family protein n=1 Tax=Lutibacter sp. Hel_I_33_5 TaxID=1566289 RepID=UPI00119C909D|nr:DUF6428 family protein [Lutibacter sp. Hel_I_33_5]TVZ55738.1 hypothetical protein OD91_1003 [Lutibacter sp. Hel_I_33_5]
MKLSEIKEFLQNLETIAFELPDGSLAPSHFHVTEVGKITKNFIDCGGTVRNEEVINFQLWNKDDYNHRLHPEKLIHIIELSEKVLQLEDLEIEVEYQGDTIGKYGLDFNGKNFILVNKATACLAEELCVIPEKKKIQLSAISASPSCDPKSGCC